MRIFMLYQCFVRRSILTGCSAAWRISKSDALLLAFLYVLTINWGNNWMKDDIKSIITSMVWIINCQQMLWCHGHHETHSSPDSCRWGQHGAHLGPTGPRWVPCWTHELCYLGLYGLSVRVRCGMSVVSPNCPDNKVHGANMGPI